MLIRVRVECGLECGSSAGRVRVGCRSLECRCHPWIAPAVTADRYNRLRRVQVIRVQMPSLDRTCSLSGMRLNGSSLEYSHEDGGSGGVERPAVLSTDMTGRATSDGADASPPRAAKECGGREAAAVGMGALGGALPTSPLRLRASGPPPLTLLSMPVGLA